MNDKDRSKQGRRGALATLAFAAAWTALLAVCVSAGAEEPATVLVYQAEPLEKDRPVDMEKVVDFVSRRINTGLLLRAYGVRALEGGKIQVTVPGRDAAAVRRVAHLVESPGTLEFRIMADSRRENDLIDRAKKAEGDEVREGDKKLLARWVPIQPGKEKEFSSGGDQETIAKRTKTVGDRERQEILVLQDSSNVTSADLEKVWAAADVRGRPCVEFQFTKDGGKRFGELTAANLPDELTLGARQLGIIVDGRLMSAPRIMSRVEDRAQITGDFSVQATKDMATIFSLKPTPVRLRKIDEKAVGAEKPKE